MTFLTVNHHLPRMPASFFGLVLGISGLGTSWRLAAAVWSLPAAIGEILHVLALTIWVAVMGLYIAKWVLARDEALAEAAHPVQGCFVGLAGVSTMLVALGVLPYVAWLAVVLFAFGAGFTLFFALWITGKLWQGNRDPLATTAALYLPAGAGSFVTGIVASALGYPDWGQLAFGAGLFSWLAIESVVLHRLLTSPDFANVLRPTLGIQLAPPAVGCLAYLGGTTGHPDAFAHALLGYGVFQLLLLARLVPWLMKQPFEASYWGVTFGMTALSTASLKILERGDKGAVAMIAPFVFVISNIVVGAIAVGTVYLLVRGDLVRPASQTPR